MKPAATGLNQQGHTELHKKTSSLCERWDGHLERTLDKLFNDIEHWTLQVTVHFCGVILQHGIKYCKSCNYSMKIFCWNFLGLLKTLSAVNPEILVKKSLSIVNKLHFVLWDVFWATWYMCRSGYTKHRSFCMTARVTSCHFALSIERMRSSGWLRKTDYFTSLTRVISACSSTHNLNSTFLTSQNFTMIFLLVLLHITRISRSIFRHIWIDVNLYF